MDPLVSIVVPVYNGANYMREAIDSALAQTYSNIEIIVVNDGSNDGGATRDIALSYGDKIRYFEKDNGGVSTALNLAIKNMRGKYFSWLSHDDVYLPEKIQVQIDALRQAGDMSRAVYGLTKRLFMPNLQTAEFINHSVYRQEFLETGAFLSTFGLVHGCALLIPKFYFDAYGGFEETFRAIQDYKKFFELFRGKRLIYVRKLLNFCRIHQKNMSINYNLVPVENDWMHSWMYLNMTEDDIVGSGLTDLYNLYSALFTRKLLSPNLIRAREFLIKKILTMPESPDTDDKLNSLDIFINDDNFETFFPEEEENIIRTDFYLRGIALGDNVKFIPFNQFENVKTANNVRLLTRDTLMQVLIDTPIKKKIFEEWLSRQGGQRA